MNVNKYYWAAQKRKEKVDHGNDFNDYCQTPITNICRVLVLDPTDFTALLYLCFSKPLPDHTVPLTAQHRETRETLLIVPTFLLIVPTSIICISLYRNKSVVNEFIDCARELTASGRQSAEGGRGRWQA